MLTGGVKPAIGMGGFYRRQLEIWFAHSQILALTPTIARMLTVHLSLALILFCLPIVRSLEALLPPSSATSGVLSTRLRASVLVALLVLATLTVSTSVFTALTPPDAYANANRIHARYYNFVFPLFLINFAALEAQSSVQCSRVSRVALLAAPVLLLIALGGRQYRISLADYPELFVPVRTLGLSPASITLALGMWLTLVLGELVLRRPVLQLYLLFLLGVYLVGTVGMFFVHAKYQKNTLSCYETASLMRSRLSPNEINTGVIVAT